MSKPVFAVTEWPNQAKIAVAINVMYEQWSQAVAPGIGPMGNPLREGIDYQAISWAAYGRETGIWNILETLSEFDVVASVYASGILSESAGNSLAAVVGGGHEICGHSWAQEMVPTAMSKGDERDMIRRCVDALSAASGQRPLGWVSPRCTPSAHTAELLAAEGFEWFGDVFDTDLPYPIVSPAGEIVALPFGMELNDLPLTIRYGRPIADLYTDFESALAAREERTTPSILDITVHAHIGGRPDGIHALRQILRRVIDSPSCWVVPRARIATAARAFAATNTTRLEQRCE